MEEKFPDLVNCRDLDDYLQEQKREHAERNDPFHPIRRRKGEKHRNKSRRR